MTPNIRSLIEEEAEKRFPKHKPPFDKETEHGHALIKNIWIDGHEAGFALAVEMHQGVREALEFYGNPLSKFEECDEPLDWTIIGRFARNALTKLKEDLGE